MSDARRTRGLSQHFLLTLRLNFRNGRALLYGYAMPVLFLLAFGGLFRGDTPALLHEMGQLLTITILGGACFGLPTALVAEREKGIWRRYRLLPVSAASLVVVTLAARIVIVASAAILQVVLARLIYGTPLPAHPVAAAVAFTVVTLAFLGLGLLITSLADDVPAVQALGQCVFLPMIILGGVGVPLIALPAWAQRFSGFMPGRYAVDVLQRSFSAPRGLHGAGFSFIALVVIGVSAAIVGARLFRWDVSPRLNGRPRAVTALALAAWAAVGVAALSTGRLEPVSSRAGYTEITEANIAAIAYDDVPSDGELVTRLAPPFSPGTMPARVRGLQASLKTWPPARTGDVVEDAMHLLSIAAVADHGADVHEAEIARMIFDELQTRYGHARLRQVLAWIILHPDDPSVVTEAPELDLRRRQPTDEMVRERCVLYAKKFLGRITGAISAP
jgi:ABC-2 type transport system permease protein